MLKRSTEPLDPLLQGADPLQLTEDAAIELAEDYIPTLDEADADTPPPATYRDWLPENTRVVTYTNDPEAFPRDRYAPSLSAARAECELVFGRIYETNALPGRWFFRVSSFRVSRS